MRNTAAMNMNALEQLLAAAHKAGYTAMLMSGWFQTEDPKDQPQLASLLNTQKNQVTGHYRK